MCVLYVHVHVHVSSVLPSFRIVGLQQTIPKSGTVCPGAVLQYTCTSSLGEQYWTIGTSHPFIITESSVVNSSGTIDDFFLILAQKDADCSTCTATNDIATSKYDGQQVACYSGTSFSNVTIAVAGTLVF